MCVVVNSFRYIIEEIKNCMLGFSFDLNYMLIFFGSSLGMIRYQVKNCMISGMLWNSFIYSVLIEERKWLGMVCRILNSELIRNVIIYVVIDNVMVI